MIVFVYCALIGVVTCATSAVIYPEQALVAVKRELITRVEKKNHATLARVWGEKPSDFSSAASVNPSTGVPFEEEMPQAPCQIESFESAS